MILVLIIYIYLIPHRAEQQRNQALENAETLKEAFKEYKSTISFKLKTVSSITMFVMFGISLQ